MLPHDNRLATSSSATATSAFYAASSGMVPSNDTIKSTVQAGAENGECRLLGPFALFVQGALGILALSVLVFKRWRERPQRPFKIWAFDASKQVVGSSLLHIANLFMSMLSSGGLTPTPKAGDYQANPCSFYLLNLAIDTTLGIPILICLLRLLTHCFRLTSFGEPSESIESGNYGQPPKTKWWLKQCLIYFIGLIGMKLCVFFIFKLCPWIIEVGDWALRWTEGDERVQVFFVMLFFPLVMNALQYYIIDSFIKEKRPEGHEPVPSEESAEDAPALAEQPEVSQRDLEDEESRNELDGEDENEAIKGDQNAGKTREAATPHGSEKQPKSGKSFVEYDAALDGEASSSGGSGTPREPSRPGDAVER